jgi:hypothetical protein
MTPSTPPTDGELLRLVAGGDRAAFSTLYVRHETIVAGYLVRRTRDPELAADLTAETFAAAILGAGGFRDEGQSATSWSGPGSGGAPSSGHDGGSGSSAPSWATRRWSASRR